MKKTKNTFTGKLTLYGFALTVVFGLLTGSGAAYGKNEIHGKVARKVSELKEKGVFSKESRVFSVAQSDNTEALRETVRNFTLLKLKSEVSDIINSKPDYLKLTVPFNNGLNQFTLLLYKHDISPNGFTLLTSDGLPHTPDNSIVHYRGSIENDGQSIVAVSFSSTEVMGMISNANGNYVLGKIENNTESLYMIYNDKDLIPRNDYECATNDVPQGYTPKNEPPSTLSVNCVNWYWETDYDIYLGKGSSVSNVNSYMQGIFNEVSTLYDNDGMNITLLTIFIWSTVDPYTGPSTNNYLDQFGSYRTSFNGDLQPCLAMQEEDV
ncbi:MAG: hypothetical protein ABI855_12145 [Bacteroidota bacterium]